MNKVALITGATRGIGRNIAHKLAKNGYNIVVAGKSIEDKPNLPGNIYTVADEVETYGVKALPVKTDVRHFDNIKKLVHETKKEFNRLDVVINNAGALWWQPILDTPHERYDLVNDVNVRASFLLSKYAIPLMLENGGGHIIMQSPPLPKNLSEANMVKNKTAYMISKWGMTLSALGVSAEYKSDGIAANTLWPSTPIESYALINNNLGTNKMWRKADIISDAVLEIVNEDPNKFSGHQLIDEEYLRTKGYTDFTKYQCVNGHEPPKLNKLLDFIKN